MWSTLYMHSADDHHPCSQQTQLQPAWTTPRTTEVDANDYNENRRALSPSSPFFHCCFFACFVLSLVSCVLCDHNNHHHHVFAICFVIAPRMDGWMDGGSAPLAPNPRLSLSVSLAVVAGDSISVSQPALVRRGNKIKSKAK